MNLEIQFKLKNNPIFIKYLHDNSYWYKILSRNPNMYDSFILEAKTNLGLRPSDKINQALTKFEMISSILSSLK